MDLELSDEQVWLEESINTLLDRTWPVADAAWQASDAQRQALWASLVDVGMLAGADNDLGAVELCLVARAMGSHLAVAPLRDSVALRYALEPLATQLPEGFGALVRTDKPTAIALLEPGTGWSPRDARATVDGDRLTGVKAGVEHAEDVDFVAVVARSGSGGAPVVGLVSAAGLGREPQESLDPTIPLHRVRFNGAEVASLARADVAGGLISRLTALSGLLVSAEAIGAAAHVLGLARQYASERKQFGRTIASNQALRHLLADLHVRQASGWSTVLYAAAALDDDIPGALQTASVAKAYVARAAREVAHGSMQVFGGIAFTAEHPAHRFLRRIVVREQQFGDAAHHEREIGRQLADGIGARLADGIAAQRLAAPRVLAD